MGVSNNGHLPRNGPNDESISKRRGRHGQPGQLVVNKVLMGSGAKVRGRGSTDKAGQGSVGGFGAASVVRRAAPSTAQNRSAS